MADWNPALYSRFEDERTRPARDLLARVLLDMPGRVVDLGCGPGNSTELLVERYPEASVLGLDSSPAMIDAARKRLPGVRFETADVATWTPDRPVDLIFANAVLQWLPGHPALLPRLFGLLAPGGVLAVQMPDNLDEPSHRAMRTVAAQEPWADRMDSGMREQLPSPTAYYDMLVGEAATVDVWRTAYHHPMESPAAIVAWLRATGLRPYLDRLDSADQVKFLSRYEALLDRDYPVRADGKRLLAFPRLFIVAKGLRPSHITAEESERAHLLGR